MMELEKEMSVFSTINFGACSTYGSQCYVDADEYLLRAYQC